MSTVICKGNVEITYGKKKYKKHNSGTAHLFRLFSSIFTKKPFAFTDLPTYVSLISSTSASSEQILTSTDILSNPNYESYAERILINWPATITADVDDTTSEISSVYSTTLTTNSLKDKNIEHHTSIAYLVLLDGKKEKILAFVEILPDVLQSIAQGKQALIRWVMSLGNATSSVIQSLYATPARILLPHDKPQYFNILIAPSSATADTIVVTSADTSILQFYQGDAPEDKTAQYTSDLTLDWRYNGKVYVRVNPEASVLQTSFINIIISCTNGKQETIIDTEAFKAIPQLKITLQDEVATPFNSNTQTYDILLTSERASVSKTFYADVVEESDYYVNSQLASEYVSTTDIKEDNGKHRVKLNTKLTTEQLSNAYLMLTIHESSNVVPTYVEVYFTDTTLVGKSLFNSEKRTAHVLIPQYSISGAFSFELVFDAEVKNDFNVVYTKSSSDAYTENYCYIEWTLDAVEGVSDQNPLTKSTTSVNVLGNFLCKISYEEAKETDNITSVYKLTANNRYSGKQDEVLIRKCIPFVTDVYTTDTKEELFGLYKWDTENQQLTPINNTFGNSSHDTFFIQLNHRGGDSDYDDRVATYYNDAIMSINEDTPAQIINWITSISTSKSTPNTKLTDWTISYDTTLDAIKLTYKELLKSSQYIQLAVPLKINAELNNWSYYIQTLKLDVAGEGN